MKKILIGILLGVIASCNSDDNTESNESNKSIIGLWNRTKLETISGSDEMTILETDIPENDCENKDSFEFTSDGKYQSETYYIKDNECMIDNSVSFNYEFNPTTNIIILKNLDGDDIANGEIEFVEEGIVLIAVGEDANGDGVDDIYKHYLVK